MVRGVLAALLALVLVGGHIATLQAVAWAGMLATRVQQQGWSGAVASTFDGDHPCDMCRAVQCLKAMDDGRDQGGPAAPDPLQKAVKKIDLALPGDDIRIGEPALGDRIAWPPPSVLAAQADPGPELPPPRA